MALLSLNSYVNKLNEMLKVSSALTQGDVGGWKTPRQGDDGKKPQDLQTKYANLARSSRDHVLTSMDITSEVLCELPSVNGGAFKSQNYAKVWFSEGIGREINDELEVVVSVLQEAMKMIRARSIEQSVPEDAYLLHVNDLDRQSMSVRPSLKNYAYMGSQMSIISPSGAMYSFTMDRSYRAQDQKHSWTAMVIPKEYVLCKFIHSDGLINPLPASGHIDTMIGRIAFFEEDFTEFDRTWNQLYEYGYQIDPANPNPPAPFTKAVAPLAYTEPDDVGQVLLPIKRN